MNECQEKWDVYHTCVQAALIDRKIIKKLDAARKEAPFEDGGQLKP